MCPHQTTRSSQRMNCIKTCLFLPSAALRRSTTPNARYALGSALWLTSWTLVLTHFCLGVAQAWDLDATLHATLCTGYCVSTTLRGYARTEHCVGRLDGRALLQQPRERWPNLKRGRCSQGPSGSRVQSHQVS
ncbi:hypothetical protein PYCCODRAFT_777147 [Trametes coccinea BRFM310]|uniref:Uncharacterized protein n=1 Tax=Trametes coccinea (strain BRFM310) TaxID=1353009 RepID=A0A1Y2J0N4_TRAC3|nr:hypothetical protein PYCCODRAFT_777147 [Trametes coccinea BRFM310]